MALAAVLAIAGCAKVSPPAGGPVDRTPPRVVAHAPAADATSVPAGAQIRIDFDEGMDRRRTAAAVFISPAVELSFSWEGATRLWMHVKEGLAADRTYVVTLGTDARDRRGNRLQQAYEFAFATGATLDRGVLVGRVIDADGPARGATVWTYDLDNFDGRFGVDGPAYATQTGSDGGFRFARLAPARYRLLAFVDEDRDREYDPGERLALASADAVVSGSDTTQGGDLRLYDPSGPPHLQRLSAIDGQRLLLVFDRRVEAGEIDIEIDGLPVEGVYVVPGKEERLYVRTAPQQAGRTYRPHLTVAGQGVEVAEPVRGSGRADTRAPQLIRTEPGQVAVEVAELVFTFDEAMAPVLPPSSFWQESDSTTVPAGRWSWRDPLRLVFRLDAPLSPGRISLRGRWSGLTDLAGNAPQDSVLQMATQVLTPARHPRLQGQVVPAPGIDPASVRIVATADGRRRSFRPDAGGHMAVSGLPPGRYQVFGYADVDGDGRHDAGRLEPYVAAEPFGWLGTVELQANTTTEADLHVR